MSNIMQVSVGGPQSQLEAEAKKKLITEREIKAVLENDSTSKELRLVKAKMRELLEFYDRIIKSLSSYFDNLKK